VILPHHGITPRIPGSVFVAPSADIIGDVEIGEDSSVWFQVVIRGDVNLIRIGNRTNIQDLSMLHVTRGTGPLRIGDAVTVGHSVTLHACTIGSRVLLGMGCTILDDAVIGDDCLVGAGALVTKGTRIPAGNLVLGSPAKVVRELRQEEREFLKRSAENYVSDAQEYRKIMAGLARPG
jgi:carbonic anhydrase/acetyltransferase-like protein (isoleucine patch superfamily)